MARRKFRPVRYRSTVPRKTQRVRKLAGMRPVSTVERIAGGIGTVAKVARQVSMLSGLINSEVKFVDNAVNTSVGNTGSANASLTVIAEGDDYGNRNGRWILAKSIQGKFQFTIHASATATSCGWVLYMDKKASIGLSGTPWVDVLSTADPNALINRGDSDRFVILRRGVVDLSINGQRTKHVSFYFPLKGIHVKYNGTTSTSYDQNNIFIAFISTEGTNTPTLTGNFRFDYYDN